MSNSAKPNSQGFKSFKAFYPYYLSEHQNLTCRRLHFIGTALIIALWIWVVLTQNWWYLLLTPVLGYGFAWVGHFFFEHNKPATFKHPAYSLLGDWVMFFDILRGKVSILR
ncbi:MAG: DUF962 domain-containing protein [Hellea sp.]|nr:DUF962 domain-containing protein [Hellea sp.]